MEIVRGMEKSLGAGVAGRREESSRTSRGEKRENSAIFPGKEVYVSATKGWGGERGSFMEICESFV